MTGKKKSRMTRGEYRRAIRGINVKINAVAQARRELRDLVPLNRPTRLQIEIEWARLKFTQDDLEDWKDAFKLDERSLPAPSADTILSLQEKVSELAKMAERSATVRAIIRTTSEIVGGLTNASLI